ncbi:MAG: hypothetical protein JO033_22105 [Acidobacteriaceae bacterium]|nr:hypothetical protein [Acidobacteriaceae bacterium]
MAKTTPLAKYDQITVLGIATGTMAACEFNNRAPAGNNTTLMLQPSIESSTIPEVDDAEGGLPDTDPGSVSALAIMRLLTARKRS